MDIAKARSLLTSALRPLFIFDDDVDGLCSFLQLWRMCRCGKGMPLKSRPVINEQFLRHVKNYDADLVVVLDIPNITQEFIDNCPVPVLWVDHHEVGETDTTLYLNPLKEGKESYPTSYWSYLIADSPRNDLWIAAAGYISDWQIVPDIHAEVEEAYASLVPPGKKAQELLFDSEMGELIKILMFNLKGGSSDVRKSINTLTRIDNPFEILKKKSPAGRFIARRAVEHEKAYNELLDAIRAKEYPGKMLVFVYEDTTTSMTSFLSNEILYHYPDKVTIIARHKGDEYKCSLRASPPLDLHGIVSAALSQVEGYGGGHMQACGACIKEHDFQKFVELIREQVEKE